MLSVNADGSTQSGSLIDEIVREGTRRMLAAALEAEVNQYITELAAETNDRGCRLVVRDGHHRPRTVVTAAGPVEVKASRKAPAPTGRTSRGNMPNQQGRSGHTCIEVKAGKPLVSLIATL